MRMLDYKQWMELLNKIFSNLLVLLKRGQVSVFIVEIIHSSSSKIKLGIRFMSMAFNATFDNISVILWRSVLLMEETGVPGENHRPVVYHWQTLSHNVVLSTTRLSGIWTHNISGDRHWLHKIKFKKKLQVHVYKASFTLKTIQL